MQDSQFYIKNGLIYGTVNIIYLMITYVMGVDTMMSYYNVGLSLLVSLGLMVFMGTQVRGAMGGYMTLSEGFKSLMVIYGLGAFLYLLFNHVLGTVIDPELPGKLAEATIEKSMSMMESFDLPEDQIEEMYDEMESEISKSMYENYSVLGFAKTYVMTLFFGAIGAVIGAAITKKENPNPFNENNAG
ncbi:MAG: DUF4199 domain-containing protein [Salibacteraceae bacterium]